MLKLLAWRNILADMEKRNSSLYSQQNSYNWWDPLTLPENGSQLVGEKTFNFCGCIYEFTGPTERKKERKKEKNTVTTSNIVINMTLNQSQIWGFNWNISELNWTELAMIWNPILLDRIVTQFHSIFSVVTEFHC